MYFEAERNKHRLTSAADGPYEVVSPTQHMVVIQYDDRQGKISCNCVDDASSFDVVLDKETIATSANNLGRQAAKKYKSVKDADAKDPLQKEAESATR